MRACVVKEFGSADNLRVETVPDPVPGAGQVVIEVRAAGITYADRLIIEGKYQALPQLPFVPGQEVSGVIAAVGKDVKRFEAGMGVMGFAKMGAYAERALLDEADCYVLPKGMSYTDAAAMGIAYQTAYIALMDRAQFKSGETVLVTGASGGVGLAAVQIAKALDATVLAGLTSPAKGPGVIDGGADHVIDLTTPDLAKSLRDQVNAATGGRGADVLIDVVGGDVFDAGLRALRWRGRAVVLGFVGERVPSIKSNYLLIKNIGVSGLYWDSYRREAPGEVQQVQQALFDLYAAGRLKPVIMETLPLENASQAFARISKREILGRVLLTPTQ